jgi:hypothetical protein
MGQILHLTIGMIVPSKCVCCDLEYLVGSDVYIYIYIYCRQKYML